MSDLLKTGQLKRYPVNTELYNKLDSVCDEYAGEISRAAVIGIVWILMQDLANRNIEADSDES